MVHHKVDTKSNHAQEDDQIQQVLARINEDAKQRTDQEFVSEILEHSVTTLAAHGGVIWQPRHQGAFHPVGKFGTGKVDLKSEPQQQPLTDLYKAATSSATPVLIPPKAAGRNETPYLRMLVPIMDGGRPLGVLEILQRDVDDDAAHAGYLQFMQQVADSISRFDTTTFSLIVHDLEVTILETLTRTSNLRS